MWENYDYDDRSPILDVVTGKHISLRNMAKGADKGTYVCAVCYKLKNDPIRSAVYVKGGTEKTCLHAAHFPKNGCAAGQTAIHIMVSEAIAVATNGVLECYYPDGAHKADVRSGSVYWEVIYTSWMTEKKRDALRPMIESGQIKIKVVNIERIPREMLVELLDIRHNNDDWQHRWFEMINVPPFTKEYRPRDSSGIRKAVLIEPIGDNKVGHNGNQCCTGCEFAYVEGSNDLFHCTQADRHYGRKMVVTNGSRCEWGLGIKPITTTGYNDDN